MDAPMEAHEQIDDTMAEGVARMELGLEMLNQEVVDDPDVVLSDELARQGVEPTEAQRIAQGVTVQNPDAEGMVAGFGSGLAKLLKRPGVEPLSRAEAASIVKTKPSTNVLGTSDFKLDFGGPKKTNASLNKDVERFITKYKTDYEAARGSLSDEDATTAALTMHKESLKDLNDVLGLPKSALTQVETRAVLMYLRQAMDEFESLRKGAKKGDAGSLEALRAQGAVVHTLMEKIAGWRREAGATTREYRGIDLKQKFEDGHAVHDALDIAQRFGDIPPAKFKAWMDSLDSKGRLAFFNGLTKEPEILSSLRRGNDVLVRSYVDSLLLNHATFQRNLFGNLFTLMFAVPERATMAAWGGAQRAFYKMLYNAELGVPTTAPREAQAMLAAFPAAFSDGLAAFAKMWKSRESTFTGKLDTRAPNALITAAEALAEDNPARYLAMGLGKVWELGSRGLMSTDEAFKAILYRMDLNAQAERYAHFLGHTDEATKKIALHEFYTNPPDTVRKSAREFASINTFTGELGPFMSKVAAAVDAGGLPARTIATFISAPANLMSYAAQRNPVLGLMSPQNWSDLMAGGARRDAALARYTTASAATAFVYTMALNGWITGGGPTDDNLKKLYEQTGRDGYKWQPYSFFIPGRGYFSYRDFEPFAMMFGSIADFLEASRVMDPEAANQIGTGLVIATGRMVMNSSWMEGMSKFTELMSGAMKGEKSDEDIAHFIEDRAMGFWPSGARQLRNEFDPHKRQSRIPADAVAEWSGAWRIVNESVRQWMNRTPGFSQGLPADLAPLGEPQHTRQLLGLGLFPMHHSPEQDPKRGPIYKAWIESGLDPRAGNVPWSLEGPTRRSIIGKIALGTAQVGADTPQDRYAGIELSQKSRNQISAIRVKNGMVDELYNLVSGEEWGRMPQGKQQSEMRSIFDKHTSAAVNEWLEEYSDVRDQINALKEKKGEAGFPVKR